jgi:hypothetical protein
MLEAASVPYIRHLAIYPRDQYPDPVPDEVWLDLVGRNGWTVITADKRNRYEPLEMAKIIQHEIREFIFTSGNLTGSDMAQILRDNLPKIDRLCKRTHPPLIASIARSGITVRYPRPTKPIQREFKPS